MSSPEPSNGGRAVPGARLLSAPPLHVAILALACFLVYANNYRHEYQLDSGYTILQNAAVRDLSNIPRYFVDPSTYTSLREQVDYRPVLQATYALNYRMGGYSTPWWHFTQILLHWAVTLGLYAFGRRFAARTGAGDERTIAFLAALVFAVHPAASGVVNYLNARSSLLAAAFLAPAVVLYMKPVESGRYDRTAWGTSILYALALFTKVEAVGALGVFLAYEVWQRARLRPDRPGFFGDLLAAFDRRSLRRAWPILAVTALYTAVRLVLMAPYDFAEARHAADVGGWEYLLTQLTAWWYYLFRWIAPVRLVADYASYPVFRSVTRPEVLLALGGWTIVVTALLAAWKRIPHVGFLAIAALALLAPTSSISPLAEMVNEHRPYLAVGILWTGLMIAAARAVRPRIPSEGFRRASLAAGGMLVVLALSLLTVQRNRVFGTSLDYWGDVVAKAPSARSTLNYGLALMSRGDLDAAEEYYRRSLELAPNWYITHIDMGVLLQTRGDLEGAAWHFDRAVETDRYSGLALVYRGEFRLSRGEYDPARRDFEAALGRYLGAYRVHKGLATAHAGLGNTERSLEHVDALLALDPRQARFDVPGISAPFFQYPDLNAEGVRFYEALASRLPDEWWVHENLARLAAMTGDRGLAASAGERARRLKAAEGGPGATGAPGSEGG